MIELTETNFNETLENSEGVAVVQFTAPWCGPCRMIAPVLTELEQEGRLSYYKVNIDENPELARDFQIMSIPTLFFYSDGKRRETTVGMQRKAQIEEILNQI